METTTREIKLEAELAMRRLEAEHGADPQAIRLAFEPLMQAIARSQKRGGTRYETKA